MFMADASPIDENEGHLLHSPPSLVKFKSSFNGVSLSDFDISSGVPRFTYVFDEKTIDPGTRLSLKCEATGNPLPQITWMLDDNAIFEHSRIRVGDYVTNNGYVNSFVNISSIRIEEGGAYTCTGELSPLSLSVQLWSEKLPPWDGECCEYANISHVWIVSGLRRERQKRRRKKVMWISDAFMVKQLFQLFLPSLHLLLPLALLFFFLHTSLSTFNLPPPLDSHFICALCFARLTLAFHSLAPLSLCIFENAFFSSFFPLALAILHSQAGRQYFAVNVLHLATFHPLLPAFSVILFSRSRHELLTPTHWPGNSWVLSLSLTLLFSSLHLCSGKTEWERERATLLSLLSPHYLTPFIYA